MCSNFVRVIFLHFLKAQNALILRWRDPSCSSLQISEVCQWKCVTTNSRTDYLCRWSSHVTHPTSTEYHLHKTAVWRSYRHYICACNERYVCTNERKWNEFRDMHCMSHFNYVKYGSKTVFILYYFTGKCLFYNRLCCINNRWSENIQIYTDVKIKDFDLIYHVSKINTYLSRYKPQTCTLNLYRHLRLS